MSDLPADEFLRRMSVPYDDPEAQAAALYGEVNRLHSKLDHATKLVAQYEHMCSVAEANGFSNLTEAITRASAANSEGRLMKVRTTALDKLFSQYIRARVFYRCEYSGESDGIKDAEYRLRSIREHAELGATTSQFTHSRASCRAILDLLDREGEHSSTAELEGRRITHHDFPEPSAREQIEAAHELDHGDSDGEGRGT